jgi:hypothetical protein
MAMMPYLLTPKQKKCARKILIIATKTSPPVWQQTWDQGPKFSGRRDNSNNR